MKELILSVGALPRTSAAYGPRFWALLRRVLCLGADAIHELP